MFFRGRGLKIDIFGFGKAYFRVLRPLNETSDRDLQFGGAHSPRSPFLTMKVSAAVDMLPRKTAFHFLCQIWLPGQASCPSGDRSEPEVSGYVLKS